jgi:hypothetical protein
MLSRSKSMRLDGITRAPSNPVKRRLLLAFALLPWWVPVRAATLERLSLEDMIAKSSAIVRGKVTGSWAALTGSVIYTHYTVDVSERFKGPAQGTVEIVAAGGVVNNLRQSFSGSPTLNQGDEFVFFLWTSKAGLTQVMGLTQGLFTIPRGSASGPTAFDPTASDPMASDPITTRAASHELMLDPVTSRPVKDGTLTMRLSELRSRIAATLAANGGRGQ